MYTILLMLVHLTVLLFPFLGSLPLTSAPVEESLWPRTTVPLILAFNSNATLFDRHSDVVRPRKSTQSNVLLLEL